MCLCVCVCVCVCVRERERERESAKDGTSKYERQTSFYIVTMRYKEKMVDIARQKLYIKLKT